MLELFIYKTELARSIYDFGTGFQILDDLNSIINDNFSDLKGCSDDIREGKLSYPILLFFKESSDLSKQKELEEMLNKREGSFEDLSRLRILLNEGINISCLIFIENIIEKSKYEIGNFMFKSKETLEIFFGNTHDEFVSSHLEIIDYLIKGNFYNKNK